MATGIWSSEMYGLAERTTQCANLQCCHCCLRHSQWMATCFVSARGQGLKPLEIICTQWWLVHTGWFFKPTGDLRHSNEGELFLEQLGSLRHRSTHGWPCFTVTFNVTGDFEGGNLELRIICMLYFPTICRASWNPLNTLVTLTWTNGQWKRIDWLNYGGNLFPTFLIEVLLYSVILVSGNPKILKKGSVFFVRSSNCILFTENNILQSPGYVENLWPVRWFQNDQFHSHKFFSMVLGMVPWIIHRHNQQTWFSVSKAVKYLVPWKHKKMISEKTILNHFDPADLM